MEVPVPDSIKSWCGSVKPSPAALIRAALKWVRVRSPFNGTKKERPKGLSFFGAGDRTRTGTPSLAADFESATSTISSHRQVV